MKRPERMCYEQVYRTFIGKTDSRRECVPNLPITYEGH